MDLDVAGVKKLVKEKEDELGELYTRMDEDFDLYTLEEYEAEKGYESYTTSQPRNFFTKVTHGLDTAEMSMQIKLQEKASEKERRGASVGELYLFGALNAIDRNMRVRGEPPLRQTLGYYACLRGWLGLRALVYTLDDETVFDVIPWDILHTTWEKGSKGILWVASKRKITKALAKAEWDVEIAGKDTDIIDFWYAEREKEKIIITNCIIVGDEFVKEPTPHNLDRIPVFIGSVGSMPSILTKDFKSTIEHRGDSIWSEARHLYEPYNKVISRTMDQFERAIVGSIIHKSKDGRKAIEGDPYKTYQEIKLSIDDGEEIEPFPTPEVPAQTAVIHSVINTDMQMSTLPYPLAYGGTRQAMSGRALDILSDATQSVYDPRTGLLEQAYIWLCEELLSQYEREGTKMDDFSGYKPGGEFFTVKVKPKDIKPSWFVSVKIEPKMPRDMEKEIMMSLAATSKRGPEDEPLLDYQTAREDIMKLRDPDSIQDKVLVEWAERLPPIRITKVAAALQKAGKSDLAQDLMMLLRPQGAQRQPQVPPELLAAAVEALSMNPETRPIAQAILNVMGAGQGAPSQAPPGAPQGMPPQGAPSGMPPQGAPPQGAQGPVMPPGPAM